MGGGRAEFGLKAPVSYQQALFPTQRHTKSTLVSTSAWGSATPFCSGGAGHLRVTATRLWGEPKSCWSLDYRATIGVCGSLAMPNVSPDLRGWLCQVPALAR